MKVSDPNAVPPGIVVLYSDNHLVVIDKPAGLLCQGGVGGDDNALERVREWIRLTCNKQGNVFVGLVHRLDRNTSGVVIFARTSKAASRLSDLFAGRGGARIDKRYLAAVAGRTPPSGHLVHELVEHEQGVRVAPGGKKAELRFVTLATAADASLVEVELLTGRKHQIRAQFAAAGHALLGDHRYAPRPVAARFWRPALHAASIALEHPVRHDELRVSAPLPSDLAELLRREHLSLPNA